MRNMIRSTLLFGALLALMAGCGMTPGSGNPAEGSNAPGDTGRTKVIGSNSTVAGDEQATYQQQKWPLMPPR